MVAITEERSQQKVDAKVKVDTKVNTEKKAIASATNSATSEIIYPSSDGEPLAETQQHVLAILMALALLRLYLQEQQAVVFADQYLYYIEGNPRARVQKIYLNLV